MIKISDKELSSGLDLSRRIYACKNSHFCLWRKRTLLFTGFLPRICLKENCPIVIFRKTLEDDSPAYYAEALKLSQWYCVSSLAEIDRRKEIKRKQLEKMVYDLDIYGKLLALAIQPLALSAKRIPFLKPREIKALKRDWSLDALAETEQTMHEINPNWLGWLGAIMNDITVNQTYREAVPYLVYLFLMGLDNQLPNLGAMAEKEKEIFFSDIERCLSI
ncbi:MAG: hypothetical protein ABIG29_01535 [Candidatus Nealsonbacteria bacterium]